jgi:GNAT superfamily N-acetyltransferase
MARLLVSYLSLRAPPCAASEEGPGDVTIRREVLNIESYLSLYRSVGEPWRWDQRLKMDRDILSRYLKCSDCDIFIARRQESGTALGFCEFDSTHLPDVQLVNFGLVPDAQGRGLGSALLRAALHTVWRERIPQRIWLHTDEWDHPCALEVYRRAGFVVERQCHQDATDL